MSWCMHFGCIMDDEIHERRNFRRSSLSSAFVRKATFKKKQVHKKCGFWIILLMGILMLYILWSIKSDTSSMFSTHATLTDPTASIFRCRCPQPNQVTQSMNSWGFRFDDCIDRAKPTRKKHSIWGCEYFLLFPNLLRKTWSRSTDLGNVVTS